jgi:membrane associated rhomboid family serine protease
MSRIQEMIGTTPPATVGMIGLCCILYLIVQMVLDVPMFRLTFCPRLILYHGEIYRIVTSVLFHHDIFHIGMNMMSTYAIGTLLERRIGTLRMICTVVLSTGTTAVLSIGAAIVLRTLFRYDTWMNQHSIGFSGVLFHWSVLECNIGPHGNRNLFGIVEVPSFIYPWVLYVHTCELFRTLLPLFDLSRNLGTLYSPINCCHIHCSACTFCFIQISCITNHHAQFIIQWTFGRDCSRYITIPWRIGWLVTE